MSKIARLEKPIRRRIGRMVVEISEEGIRIRGVGRHKWHAVAWQQVAALDNAADDQETLSRAIDRKVGMRRLAELHILEGT